MNEILVGIWQNAPVWVWPLFVFLLLIGLLAMRTRTSSIIPFFFYPLLGLTAVNPVIGLVHIPANWIAFACSYGIGAAIAYKWQDGLILQKTGWKMTLQGDRMTLLILMLTFFSNFINGVVVEAAPQLRETVAFTIVFACVIGACSGSFTGRAFRIVTLGDRA